MKVTLIGKSEHPEATCAIAARNCLGHAEEQHTLEEDRALIRSIIASGHDSVLEHASFTFFIQGVSRIMTHQLVRHRLASYEEVSQRYTVRPDDIVIPASFASHNDDCVKCMMYTAYQTAIDNGVPPEDARYLLPEGTTTDIVVTMNARELRHFFALRCCNRAQWEIRAVANEMLRLCKQEAPSIFDKAGAPCRYGECPEGKRSCGHKQLPDGDTL